MKKEGGEDDDECMDDSYLDDDALNKRIKEVFDLDLNAMKLE